MIKEPIEELNFKEFKCDDCDKVFPNPTEYAIHSKTHYPSRKEDDSK